jgi:PTH1 family peptidyl-tRNA hydrolase
VFLIAGLGNPGEKYEQTRHNVGFVVLRAWSRLLGVRFSTRRFQAQYAQAVFQGKKVLLLCPETYMNLSGNAVRACRDYYDIDQEHILVMHDDLDLSFGRVKVGRKSGSGGHKGVASIIRNLGVTEFARVKIGIGRPRYGEPVEDFVLSPFYKDQEEMLNQVIQGAVQACELFVLEGVESAMNAINCQNFGNEEV